MIIVLDGVAGSGKSTTAKKIAHELNFFYLDTGALYRAITYYLLNLKIDANSKKINTALENCMIECSYEDSIFKVYINNSDVTRMLRTKKVNNNVSSYSKNKAVREKLIDIQRSFSDRNLVADGRDLGAVVFPSAEYKFFLTADINVRAKRIFDSKGFDLNDIASLKEIRDNLEVRDFIDSTRKNSPLIKSDNAILIDTSDLSIKEQCEKIYKVIKK